MLSTARFRELHRAGDPLLLPNAWDLASARWLVEQGAEVVGTTSLGVAVAAGVEDGTGATLVDTIALSRRLTSAGITVTVDLESGFSEDPVAVAELVAELAGSGVVGVNLEDSSAEGRLVDPARFAAKVAAVAAAAPTLYLNARTDAFWVDPIPAASRAAAATRTRETLDRAQRYLDAGASGVFVPGSLSDGTIAVLADALPAPLNVLAQPGRSLRELGGLGVARVSTGSLLFRAALASLGTVLEDVRRGATPGATALAIPDYATAAALGRDTGAPSPG
ncbi:isocitrate lyase/PEP mutase family protein [Agromyces italicus]|uniref:isocitrate lyase/PEP mutase family protein n=1 Tax=Agromyces italicus TaxID=279572 RepID=UPI0003B5B83C|nr:isocitrate lyase/phosphoenolpyruvate mutase family protein [Agromyces italicus]